VSGTRAALAIYKVRRHHPLQGVSKLSHVGKDQQLNWQTSRWIAWPSHSLQAKITAKGLIKK